MTEQANIQKLLNLYDTGRYQCDVWFYENLLILVRDLEMYEFIPSIEKNFGHVQKIHQLTQYNSDSLNDEFDEQEAATKAVQIKEQIHKLNQKQIQTIMQHCQKQKYVKYTHHAAKLMAKYNYHPKYQQIFTNILNSVYDPELRLQCIMVCTLFMLRNTQKIEQILPIYDKSIENSLSIMKQFRKNTVNIKKLIISINQKLQSHSQGKQQIQQNIQKIQLIKNNLRQYCYGIYLIYKTTIKLCDLVKILQGKNNFILRLNSYKADVQEIVQLIDEQVGNDEEQGQKKKGNQKLQKIQSQMEYMPVKQLKNLFIGQKQGIEVINRTCKICLRHIHKDQNNQNAEYHKICQQAIKELMHPQK